MFMTSIKSERHFGAIRNVGAILWITLLAAVPSFSAKAADYDDQSAKALVAKLKESKISLSDGIRQSEKQYGVAISAKFELEDGALNLSVYNAKEGRSKDAEHNVLTERSEERRVGKECRTRWCQYADKE